MSSKKYGYDEDDFYDQDDGDEDYYGEYGDYDPGESQLVGKQSSKTPAQVAPPTLFLQRTQCNCPVGQQCRVPTKAPIKTKQRLGQRLVNLITRQQFLQVLLPWLVHFSVASPKRAVRLFCSLVVSLVKHRPSFCLLIEAFTVHCLPFNLPHVLCSCQI